MKLFIGLIITILSAISGGWNIQFSCSISSPEISMVNGTPKAKSVIDTAKLTVVYTYSFVRDTSQKRIFKDRCILEVGRRYSHYYSLFADKSDSILFLFRLTPAGKTKHGGTNPNKFLKDDEYKNQDNYWFDNQSDSLMVFDMIVDKPYAYTESIPKFDWAIHPDTMHILGYVCQLATTHFRGRDYRAWFTFEIPISKGPWKLSGLPGLILKAQTLDGYFTFEANGIEAPKYVHSIYEYRYYYRYITRQAMRRFYQMSYDDPSGLLKHHGWIFATVDENGNDKEYEPGEFSFPYVPFLELK